MIRSITRFRPLLLAALAVIIAVPAAYQGWRYHERRDPGIVITDPVHRDFASIREEGVIRLITRYNSLSYFLHHGRERGFEYEFLKAFAKEHGLRVEVVIPGENEHPIDLLNSGRGDVIAANFTVTPERASLIGFSQPYNLVSQVVVVHADAAGNYRTPQDLAGLEVHVRRSSSYYTALRDLQDEGVDVRIVTVPETIDTEALMGKVAAGTIPATVADDNLFLATRKSMPELAEGPVISAANEVAWGVRANAVALRQTMDAWLADHFRIRESDNVPRRSQLMNSLRARYFENSGTVRRFRYVVQQEREGGGRLSPFDRLVQDIATDEDVDWRLVVAMMAQESGFDPDAVSWKGAVGLMQIVPHSNGFESDSVLFDTETNLRTGIGIFKEHLETYAHLDSLNQVRFALATYNAGIGHMADARRLAADLNGNPDRWEDVEQALLKLSDRRYYKDARYGFVRGSETVTYVRNIVHRYRTYDMVARL